MLSSAVQAPPDVSSQPPILPRLLRWAGALAGTYGVSWLVTRALWWLTAGLAVAMAVLLGAALARFHARASVLVAATGFVVGPLLELFATDAGLWVYAHTTFGKLPAWVFTLWPAFPVCLLALTRTLLPRQGAAEPGRERPSPRALVVGLSIIALEIPCLVVLGTPSPWLCAAITAAMLVAAAAAVPTRENLLMLALSGFFGTACETLPVALGAWSYPSAVFAGLPAWLPTGYSLFGFGLVQIALGLDAWLTARAAAGAPSATPSPITALAKAP
jgi:uncharacterized membrane protein YoaT (DUF817 family)